MLAVGFALGLAFAVPGAVYWLVVWVRTGVSPFRCVYGDPVCSLTVATWLLCIVTALAFLAAYAAARWAVRTYNVAFQTLQMEQSRALAERRTKPPDGERRPSTADGNRPREQAHDDTPPERSVPQAHATLANGKLTSDAPDYEAQSDFLHEDFEFASLGRSALIDVRLVLRVCFADEDTEDETLPVNIGNLRDDDTTWARLWLEGSSLQSVRSIGWDEAGAISTVDDEDRKLLFRPLPQRPPRVGSMMPIDLAGTTSSKTVGTTPSKTTPTLKPAVEVPLGAQPIAEQPIEEDTSGEEAAAAAAELVVTPRIPRKGVAPAQRVQADVPPPIPTPQPGVGEPTQGTTEAQSGEGTSSEPEP